MVLKKKDGFRIRVERVKKKKKRVRCGDASESHSPDYKAHQRPYMRQDTALNRRSARILGAPQFEDGQWRGVGCLHIREFGPISLWDSPSSQCQAGPEVVAVPRREPLDPARLSGISSHVQPFNDTWNIGSVCLTTALPVSFFVFSAVDHHQETTPYHRSSTSANAVTKPRPGHALNPLSCIPPPSPAPSSIPITPYSINTNTHYSTPPVPDSSTSQAAPSSLLPIAVLASKA